MKFSELVDISELQKLCESFTKLTGAVTAILDLEGNILTATGWQDICTKFHRVHPETASCCRESDTFLAGQLASGEKYKTYHCKNGLLDVAVPIITGGQHVANFFTGQFFFEPPDREYFIRQAEKYGFDQEEYLTALDRVPVFSKEYIRSLMDFFTRLTTLIGGIGQAKKRMEDALSELRISEERFSLAMDAARDGLWDWDIETDSVYYSPAYFSMLGYKPGEFSANIDTWKTLIHPDDYQRVEPDINDCLCGRTLFFEVEFRMQHKNGSWLWILARGSAAVRATDGHAKRMIGTHTNITERKKTEDDLRTNKSMLDMVINTVPQSIFWKDTESRYLGCNMNFAKTVGLDNPGQVVGKNDYDLPWPREEADAYRADDHEVMEQNRPKFHFVEPLQTATGQRLWIDMSKMPLLDEAGFPFAVLGIYEDISGKIETEEKLRQMEKMNGIGQLAGGIAHDFNNQLAGIMGYADLLHDQLKDQELRNYVEQIQMATQRSADLTAKMLAFARKGKFLSIPVDMHDIISEVVVFLKHSIAKTIVIKQRLDASPPVTRGDPTQLQNALLNLAINAADAMPDGGALTFDTGIVHLDDAYCAKLPYNIEPGAYLRICVSDTGSGIPKENLSHIFEPFFTTKDVGKGTGMGLAAVYGTIKQHKGAINVYSEIGHGTTFSVFLPIEEKLPEKVVMTKEVIVASNKSVILIIDDEKIIRDLGRDILSDLGYCVTTEENGEAGVAYYDKHWQEIDIVILDLVMPLMNGPEAYRAMRAINPKIKVLLASGYSINDSAQSLLAEGVKGFIQKPFNRTELSMQIAKILESDSKQ